MAQLLFYDEEHRYELDGEILPSVSEVLRFISREIYGEITQYKLDNAADRGTRIHKACEILDKYGAVEVDAEIAPYIKAYMKFRKDHAVQWTQIEQAIYHPALKYAGTIDRRGSVDGVTATVDIKSSYRLHKPLVGAQLNGYDSAYAALKGETTDKLFGLHLKPDATYRLVEFPKDFTLFQSCLNIHNALKKKARKKKNGNENRNETGSNE